MAEIEVRVENETRLNVEPFGRKVLAPGDKYKFTVKEKPIPGNWTDACVSFDLGGRTCYVFLRLGGWGTNKIGVGWNPEEADSAKGDHKYEWRRFDLGMLPVTDGMPTQTIHHAIDYRVRNDKEGADILFRAIPDDEDTLRKQIEEAKERAKEAQRKVTDLEALLEAAHRKGTIGK